ncbi:MAG: hypothetical protein HZB09_00305 [Candidatus Yonathbacteria bacterium]|nr:hypothetical protein [Candidatus Yonathbacteria bacterium]
MAGAAPVNSLSDLLGVFSTIINALMPFIVALAVLYFVWGVFQFVASAGDETARGAGRDKMIYGIIGIFVMVSVWGLVNLLGGTFGLSGTAQFNQGGAGQTPTVPTF